MDIQAQVHTVILSVLKVHVLGFQSHIMGSVLAESVSLWYRVVIGVCDGNSLRHTQ